MQQSVRSRCKLHATAEAHTEGSSAGIKVFYRSDWTYAHLHGSFNSGPWSDFPLKKVLFPQVFGNSDMAKLYLILSPGLIFCPVCLLLQVPSAPGKWLAGSIQSLDQSSELEFVVASANKDSWDKPKAGRFANLGMQQSQLYKLPAE